MNIKTSIVILNYNTKDYTLNCIKSVIEHTKEVHYEIILVDNASTDGSISALSRLAKRYKNIKFIQSKKNLGFAKGNNLGIKESTGEYILLLNSDTLVKDDAISKMAQWMDKHQKVGIASCKLTNEDGTVQGTGGYFPNLLRVASWMTIEDLPGVEKIIKPFHPHHAKSFYKNSSFFEKEAEVDWLTGAFLYVRTKVFGDIGGLAEDYFMYTEDTDFCFRAKKAGWKVFYLPKYSIIHFGGKSSTKEFPIISELTSVKLFYKKHYPSWQMPVLRFFLKLGTFLRMSLFAILRRKEEMNIYAKAFKTV